MVTFLAIAFFVMLLNRLQSPSHDQDTTTGATPDTSEDDAYLEDLIEAMHYEKLDDNAVRCQLCFRCCIIQDGERGFCQTRQNIEGELFSLVYGRAGAIQIDPVEKEPMHHFNPGSKIYCIGTPGCNFMCAFCQNWHLSQQTIEERRTQKITPDEIVADAIDRQIPAISFTYNEPTVFYEFAYDIARTAQAAGLNVIFHTNGAMNAEPMRQLLQHVDGVTVDLKGFDESFYREICNAELQPVLDTLQLIREEGVWLEIVNLVIPTLNDDPETIRAMSQWIYDNLGPGTPLHFSRFYPAYRLTSIHPTPLETLEEAYRIAKDVGLQYVMIGNVPGHEKNSTFCPDCGALLIQRHHFTVIEENLDDGSCSSCGREIPGIW